MCFGVSVCLCIHVHVHHVLYLCVLGWMVGTMATQAGWYLTTCPPMSSENKRELLLHDPGLLKPLVPYAVCVLADQVSFLSSASVA